MNAPYAAATAQQQPAAICALKTPADAIHILEAVRMGLVPRVTRRLTGHERSMIRPGTVWVWEEEETNMRRWTDGRRWGASRVGGGGFLVYTESSASNSPPPQPPSGYRQNEYYPARNAEGLIKQTYSTSMTEGSTGKVKKFHVVAYSSKYNAQGDIQAALPLPHQLPLLAALQVPGGIWPEWESQRQADSSRRGPTASPAPSLHSPASGAFSRLSLPLVPPPHQLQEYPLLSPSLCQAQSRHEFPPSMNYDRRGAPPPMLSPGILPSPSQSSHPNLPVAGPSSFPIPGPGPTPASSSSSGSSAGPPSHVVMPPSVSYPSQISVYPDRYYPYPSPRAYPVTPTEQYYDDRRDRDRERSPSRSYSQPQYATYQRDRYEDQPPPHLPSQSMYSASPYAAAIPPTISTNDNRYPQCPPAHTLPNMSLPSHSQHPPGIQQITSNQHSRQTSRPKLPPTPSSSTSLPDLANTQAPALSHVQTQGLYSQHNQGPISATSTDHPHSQHSQQSPKLSISNNLLNPESGMGQHNMHTLAQNQEHLGTVASTGLTLPPLRMNDASPQSSPNQALHSPIVNGNGNGVFGSGAGQAVLNHMGSSGVGMEIPDGVGNGIKREQRSLEREVQV